VRDPYASERGATITATLPPPNGAPSARLIVLILQPFAIRPVRAFVTKSWRPLVAERVRVIP
jgi:hypothetical protein